MEDFAEHPQNKESAKSKEKKALTTGSGVRLFFGSSVEFKH